ncbi:MAG: PilZ domain-containing protein [Polyangiaceae bacterium]|nr:PilZ domain-containing protein [Polyangiaceae bacterium]MCW5791970.1 PilZ domain-containing protein [Polyangiaceae bacterium]
MKDRGWRRGARRAVELPCGLIAGHSEAPELGWALDLSRTGAWIETPEPLSVGEELVVCVQPGISWRGGELQIFGEVQRAERRCVAGAMALGMAVAFQGLSLDERIRLAGWLGRRPTQAKRAWPERCESLAPLLH